MIEGTETSVHEFAPFLLEPRFFTKVWGSWDLRPWYDRVARPGNDQPIGEVWLTGDDCRAVTGPLSGKTLTEIIRAAPIPMLGKSAPAPESPLLIKMIFAREKLSVQVHPDDRMAQKYGDPRGKTECWYVLNAERGAEVALGLKPGVTLDQVRTGMQDGSLEKSLNVLSVSTGDMVFVDAGTVHAIWPGSVLLETQQNCDITYRMFDYGRGRELHLDKSLEATKLHTRAGLISPRVQQDRAILIDVEYFRVERVPVRGHRASETLPEAGEPSGLSYLFAADGSARLTGSGFEAITLPPRGIAAIPAAAGAFSIEAPGELDLIRISPRWPKKAL